MGEALRGFGLERVDGILADLGLSSIQLDDPARGFSFAAPGPLDMRLDPSLPTSAEALLRRIQEEDLAELLRELGEVPRPRAAARAIRRALASAVPLTAESLRVALEPLYPGPLRPRRLSQIFQALRIAVNHELDELTSLLRNAPSLLRPGGTLCVIAYHSLEDRIVKQGLRRLAGYCQCPPRVPVCSCGARHAVEILTRRPVTAGAIELNENPRARSARLRACRKLISN